MELHATVFILRVFIEYKLMRDKINTLTTNWKFSHGVLSAHALKPRRISAELPHLLLTSKQHNDTEGCAMKQTLEL